MSKTMKGPQWLSKFEVSFKRTGKLNFTGSSVGNLSDIGSRSSLKELNLSRTNVESLDGLKRQPHIADNSKLSSLKNFSSISKATTISFKKTPLESMKHVTIAVRIVCGDNVKVLNGKQIPESVKEKAATYPKFVEALINAGWEFVYPCPDTDTLRGACNDFNVEFKEADIDKIREDEKKKHENELEEYDEDESEDEVEVGDNFRDTLYALIAQHQEMIEVASDKFETAYNQYAIKDESDDFQHALKELLERYSFKFNDKEDINIQLENAVRSLCTTDEEEEEEESTK